MCIKLVFSGILSELTIEYRIAKLVMDAREGRKTVNNANIRFRVKRCMHSQDQNILRIQKFKLYYILENY